MVGVSGFLLKRVRPQVLVRVAALLLCTGLFSISFLPVDSPNVAFAMLTLCYGGIAAAAVGCLHPTLVSTFIKWFPEKEGFINGLVMCPTMISSFVFGSLAHALIPSAGLFGTFRIFGLSLLFIIMTGSFWVKIPEPDILLPHRPEFKENKNDRDYSVKEALQTPVFWTAFLFRFTVIATGLTYSDHAASIARDFGLPELAGMVYSPVAAIGGLLVGVLLIKLRLIRSWLLISMALLFGATSFISAMSLKSVVLAIAGIFFIGFSFGAMNATAGASIRILFGNKDNSSIYGLFSSGSTICSAIVGMICGKLIDFSGGKYSYIFLVMILFSMINILSLILLNYCVKRRSPKIRKVKSEINY